MLYNQNLNRNNLNRNRIMKEANISFSCSAVINLLSTFFTAVFVLHFFAGNKLCAVPNTAIQVLAAFSPDGFFSKKIINNQTVV